MVSLRRRSLRAEPCFDATATRAKPCSARKVGTVYPRRSGITCSRNGSWSAGRSAAPLRERGVETVRRAPHPCHVPVRAHEHSRRRVPLTEQRQSPSGVVTRPHEVDAFRTMPGIDWWTVELQQKWASPNTRTGFSSAMTSRSGMRRPSSGCPSPRSKATSRPEINAAIGEPASSTRSTSSIRSRRAS